MSAASDGSVCVSNATTNSPAARALSSEGTIALESFGVIISPFAPAEIKFSTAATCDSLSPSFLPANDCTAAPSPLAALSAPSFIFTKNGLVSVLVIRPTFTPLAAPPVAPLLLEPLSLPHAAAPAVGAGAVVAAAIARPLTSPLTTSPPAPRPGQPTLRQRFQDGVLRHRRQLVKQSLRSFS